MNTEIIIKECGTLLNRISAKLKKTYTITETTYVGKRRMSKIINGWQIVDGMLNLGINALNPNLTYINMVNSYITCDKFTNNVALYDYQTLPMQAAISQLTNPINKSGCVVKLKAGRGKSFLTAKIIAHLGVKTLIIVPKSGVLNNWRHKVFTKELFPYADIGWYFSKGKKDGDIVIMVVNSVMSDVFKFPTGNIASEEYLKQFGLVVYDEVHNYVKTQKRIKIFHKTCFRYRIGLSATPHYAGVFEPMLKWYVGVTIDCDKIVEDEYIRIEQQAIAAGEVIEQAPEFTGIVYKYEYTGPSEYTQRIINPGTGYISFGGMVKQFSQDPYRHTMIMSIISRLHSLGKNIIVFTENVEYCRRIASELSNVEAPEVGISKLLGGASDDDLAQAHQSSIIVVTFGYGKEGLSYDQLDTLVFATPRKSSMEQILPRVMRRGGDITIKRIFIDIVDMCTQNFRAQYKERKLTYEKYNFNIETRQIQWKS